MLLFLVLEYHLVAHLRIIQTISFVFLYSQIYKGVFRQKKNMNCTFWEKTLFFFLMWHKYSIVQIRLFLNRSIMWVFEANHVNLITYSYINSCRNWMSYNSIPECKPPVSPRIITVPQFIHSSLAKYNIK